jgi:hypothetical protein
LLFRADENRRSEVIAIVRSGRMTIKESPEFGTADRDEFGMADRGRIGTRAGGRWTSNKAI